MNETYFFFVNQVPLGIKAKITSLFMTNNVFKKSKRSINLMKRWKKQPNTNKIIVKLSSMLYLFVFNSLRFYFVSCY